MALKPYIINKTLHEMKHGEYLIYGDAGLHFIAPIHPAIAFMEAHDSILHGVMVQRLNFMQSRWCKRDAFIRQRCDEPHCHDVKQINGARRMGPYANRFSRAAGVRGGAAAAVTA